MAEQNKAERLLVVRVPVANLRREPVEARRSYGHDDLQETQLLFNETLLYRGEKPDWYYVEAREQVKANAEKGWQGYPGWVRKESVSLADEMPRHNGVVKSRLARLLSEPAEAAAPVLFLSLGTRVTLSEESGPYHRVPIGDGRSAWISTSDATTNVQAPSSNDLRRDLLQTASLFAGVPYLWGGRSMFMADLTATVTGVDCSGLTNLVYRANNIDIPRDARDQWLAGKKTPGGPLQAGDLIFISQENRPDSVNHVMFSTGGERFIEAAETGSTVKESSFQEKFGLDLAGLEKTNFTIQGKRLYFASVVAFTAAR
jgi:gamma-D-glutamyl-L-lysine dipeptidyl-peptidase